MFKIKKQKNKNSCKIDPYENGFIRKIILVLLLSMILIRLFTNYSNFSSTGKLFNFAIKSRKVSICLCVIAKKENLYAKEYVNHYKKLGYSHIYIYDNNDINDEKFEDVIKDEIDSGFVTIINIRGKIRGQCFAYKDCYEKYNKLYDWLSFFDFDEFLSIKEKNIQNFLIRKDMTNA